MHSPKVTFQIFTQGIMLLLTEVWENAVYDLVKSSAKIPRTESIKRWSREMLSRNKVFDEFLDSGVVKHTKGKVVSYLKAGVDTVFEAFIEWAKGRPSIRSKDMLDKQMLVTKFSEPNNISKRGFQIDNGIFLNMTFHSEKVKYIAPTNTTAPNVDDFECAIG